MFRKNNNNLSTPQNTEVHAHRSFWQRVRNWRKNEAGAVLVEYSICLPFLLFAAYLTFEFSFLKMRQFSLDRVTDQAFRELRLGLIDDPDHDKVKDAMCEKPLARFILWNCSNTVRLQVVEVEQGVWDLDLDELDCVDLMPPDDYNPEIEFDEVKPSQLMIARSCILQRGLFPPINALSSLPRYDSLGNFALVSRSAFVNEPF